MKKIKSNKGITLVALVITIIVMLILVGTTIRVSLNGGLLSKAKEAVNQTELYAEKEALFTAAIGTMGADGIVDFEKLEKNLPEGFEKVGEKTYTSKTGNIYKVDENGKVELYEEIEEDEEPETPPITPTTITFYVGEHEFTVEEGTDWETWIIEEGHLLDPNLEFGYTPSMGDFIYHSSGKQTLTLYNPVGEIVRPSDPILELHYELK